jgi:hypothetical protein
MTQIEKSARRQQVSAAARLIQKVQHAVPGVVLLNEGLAGMQEGAHGWHFVLSVAELATAGAVAVSLLWAVTKLLGDIRSGRAPHLHLGIDWADIFLGLMLFTEVASRYPVRHKIWSPPFLLGIVMIFLGLYGGKMAQRRIERRRARSAAATQ